MPKQKGEVVRRFDSMEAFITALGGNPRSTAQHEAHDRLRSLEARIRSAIGQLVVYVERDEESMVMCGRSDDHDYHVVTTRKIGVLEEPGLILQTIEDRILDQRVALACARHVVVNRRDDLALKDGPIWEDLMWPFFRGLDVPMQLRNPMYAYDKPKMKVEVIAGDKNVYVWAEKQNTELMLWRAAKMLGVSVDFPALIGKLEDERIARITAIPVLWRTYEGLAEKIESLKRSIDHDLIDEVFVALSSHPDREKLQQTEASLRDHLETLKELGLHNGLPYIHLARHVAQQLGVNLT